MPLLFAIAGIIALGLAFVVLVGPVLLVITVVRAARTARRAKPPQPPVHVALTASPVVGHLADAAFVDLVSREWPEEVATLRGPGHE